MDTYKNQCICIVLLYMEYVCTLASYTRTRTHTLAHTKCTLIQCKHRHTQKCTSSHTLTHSLTHTPTYTCTHIHTLTILDCGLPDGQWFKFLYSTILLFFCLAVCVIGPGNLWLHLFEAIFILHVPNCYPLTFLLTFFSVVYLLSRYVCKGYFPYLLCCHDLTIFIHGK